MPDSIQDPEDPIEFDDLLSEFVAEMRGGHLPQIADYCRRAGKKAELIRPLLETAMSLEKTREQIDRPQLSSNTDFSESGPPIKRVGDFRLVREAGRGGMGIVYEAVEESLNRRVAVKILDSRNSRDPVWLKRFQREARAAALLHHTNIVPVFSVGEIDGICFYVMPFIDGEPLSTVLATLRAKSTAPGVNLLLESDLKSNPPMIQSGIDAGNLETTPNRSAQSSDSLHDPKLPTPYDLHNREFSQQTSCQKEPAWFRRVAAIGLQVAEALDHACQHQVLHRDIKPSNLILAVDGTVWVTDFGLARMPESDNITATGDVLGTLRYMAPERLRGQHTVQGDLYGLGMTLYELLTLTPPFAASERVELLRQVAEDSLFPMRRIDASIPRDLETIVQRATAKAVRDRYATPAEMATDLLLFLDDRPIRSRRIGKAEIVWRWCLRNRGLASLLSSVVMLLFVIAAGSLLWGQSLRRERDAAYRAELAARSSEQKAVLASREAAAAQKIASDARLAVEASNRQRTRDLFSAYIAEMRAAYASPGQGHRLNGIQAARNALDLLPYSDLTQQQRREIRNAAAACLSHSDLSEVSRHHVSAPFDASVDIDPSLTVVAINSSESSSVLRWLDGSRPDQTLSDGLSRKNGASRFWFSPSGRWLLEVFPTDADREPFRMRIWDWRNGNLALERSGLPYEVGYSFHPDGRQYFCIEQARIKVYDLETGNLLRESPPRFRNAGLAISPDGKRLTCLVPNYPPVVISPHSWNLISTSTEIHHHKVAAWNPLNSQCIVGTTDCRIASWTGDEVSFSPPLLFGHQNSITDLQYSNRGRFLAVRTEDGNTQIREVDSDRELLTVPGETLLFSSDEQKVCLRQRNDVVVYALNLSNSLKFVRQKAQAATFSPDGRMLALSGFQGVQLYSINPLSYKCNLGLDSSGPVAWHPTSKELVTFGMFSHVARWTVLKSHTTPEFTIGPPQSVALNPVLARLGADNKVPQHWGRHAVWTIDGRHVYYADSRHGHVWRFDAASKANEVLVDFEGASYLDISDNAELVAASSSPNEHTKVWNTDTRELVLHLPEMGRAVFNPGGTILAASSRTELRTYDTSGWNPARLWRLDQVNAFRAAPVAFQPGGTLLAAAVSPYCVRLFDPDSGDDVLDLPLMEDSDITWLAFSPDGTRLAVAFSDLDVVIWNLSSLRRDLEAIGLPTEKLPKSEDNPEYHFELEVDRGTELPPPGGWWSGFELLARFEALQLNFPDAIENMDAAMRAAQSEDHAVRARLLMQRGDYHLANDSPETALIDFRQAVALFPDSSANKRRVAEMLLFGPENLRDDETALSLLQHLVTLEGSKLDDQTNLILALIRLNRLSMARNLLESINGNLVQVADPLSVFAYDCERSFFNSRAGLSGEKSGSNRVTLLETTTNRASELRESASLLRQAAIDEYLKLLAK